jgi:hypothetical protein
MILVGLSTSTPELLFYGGKGGGALPRPYTKNGRLCVWATARREPLPTSGS